MFWIQQQFKNNATHIYRWYKVREAHKIKSVTGNYRLFLHANLDREMNIFLQNTIKKFIRLP